MTKKNIFCCDGSDSFAYVGVLSKEPDITLANRTTRYLQTLVYSRQIDEKTQYVIQSDFGTQADALGPGASAQWFGAPANSIVPDAYRFSALVSSYHHIAPT